MSIERPIDWHPPVQNHGGEDIPEFYARILVGEVIAMMYAKKRNLDFPIAAGLDAMREEEKGTTARLKGSGQYYHGPDGSIFTDYKILRDESYTRIGNSLGEEDSEKASVRGFNAIKEQFHENMSIEDALQVARSIIAGWNWQS